MARRYCQCHDLPVTIVALVERPDPNADETHNLFAAMRDERVVVLVSKYRLQTLPHLLSCRWIAQTTDECSDCLRVSYCGVTNHDFHHLCFWLPIVTSPRANGEPSAAGAAVRRPSKQARRFDLWCGIDRSRALSC